MTLSLLSRYGLAIGSMLLALAFVAEASHAHGSLVDSAPGCSVCALSHGCPVAATHCLGIEPPRPVGAVEVAATVFTDGDAHHLLPARAPPAA